MNGAKVLVAGHASAEVLVLDAPLSFWGGIDPSTGTIIAPGHPQYGEDVAGRIVAMAQGIGSSSSSSILAEALRQGNGPAGIILKRPDSILVAGALAALELYAVTCPIVVCDTLPPKGTIWSIKGDRLTQAD